MDRFIPQENTETTPDYAAFTSWIGFRVSSTEAQRSREILTYSRIA